MTLNQVLCKDGGFATQLASHVTDRVDGDPLWSARFNLTNSEAVIRTHLDYLRANADIISTNTYQASLEGYKKHLNLTDQQCIELIKSTVKLARTARERYLKEKFGNDESSKDFPLIMGSIGPYGAHLHDGSEYSGNYADTVPADVITKWHRTRIDAILDAGVDGLAIETIPCQLEAEALIDLLCDSYPGVKFWISLQCKNETSLAHGENFAEVALSIWQKLKLKNATQNCFAIGVNCINPKYVTALFNSLNQKSSEEISKVVYANSGELYDVTRGWYGVQDCSPLDHYVPEWIRLGAKIIGGCCRVYPRDIERIKETIKKIVDC